MKIERLLAMIVLLLNRGRISAKELAERFEVSTKTIYRDMDALCRAGIPIAAHQGTSGGFEMMDQYTISRQLLTMDEILSVITAVQGVKAALDDPMTERLLDKVESMIRYTGQGPEARSSDLFLDLHPWGQGTNAREKVKRIRQAIRERKKTDVLYVNMNGQNGRRILEPGRLILKGNVWYLQAYCTLRAEFRVFRISRMQDIKLLTDTFEPRELPLLNAYDWQPEWSAGGALSMVTLRFSPAVRHRVVDAFNPDRIITEEDGSLRVRGELYLDEWFYGMVLSYGDQVVIEEPEHAAAEVCRRARKMIEQYDKPDRLMSN